MEAFRVSVNQSSTDLNRYIALSPSKMSYNKSARTYVRGDEFSPLFHKPDASGYLAQLRSVEDGILDRCDYRISVVTHYDAAPTMIRGVVAATFRSVIPAIRRSEEIESRYQSLSRPQPIWRWIAPHAIGFDGFRSHARAFCLTYQTFKGLLLSRMLETRATQPSEISAESDADWNKRVTLEFGSHPGISETQQKVIALDYGMRGGRAKIHVRIALLN